MQTKSLDLERGSSQFAYIVDNANLSQTGNITIEGLFNIESFPSLGAYGMLASKWKSGGNASWFFGFYNPSGTTLLNFAYSTDGSYQAANDKTISLPNNLVVGRWVHLAVVFTASTATIKWYINGRLITTTTASGTSIYDSTANFGVGASYDSGGNGVNFGDGKLKNLRYWSTARTQKEIIQFMGTSAEGESGLVDEWKFEDNYNGVNGNNLTASGSPVFAADVPNTLGMKDVANWTLLEKINVDISSLGLSADLDLYPINVTSLLSASFGNLETDGKDLRFTTDEAGLYEVPYELVSIDTSGETIQAWVLLPTVTYNASFTALYVWGGYASAVGYASTDIMGGQSVWNSNYGFVQHQEANSNDSTVNAVNGTNANVTYDAGKIGNKSVFNGSNARVTNTFKPDLVDGTIQFWGQGNDVDANAYFIFNYNNPSGTNNRFYLYINAAGNLAINLGKDDSEYDTGVAITTVKHVSVVYTSTNFTAYVNGAVAGSTQSRTAYIGLGASMYFGSSSTGSWLTGSMDEIRYNKEQLSFDWIKTDYNLQNSPATYITNLPIGGGSGMFLMF